jgi:PTS system galactitol-specific IIC component
LAKNVGMLQPGTEVASLDQGGAPTVYILSQIFKFDNVLGFTVIGMLYGIGLIMTYTRYRRLKALKIEAVKKSSENKIEK